MWKNQRAILNPPGGLTRNYSNQSCGMKPVPKIPFISGIARIDCTKSFSRPKMDKQTPDCTVNTFNGYPNNTRKDCTVEGARVPESPIQIDEIATDALEVMDVDVHTANLPVDLPPAHIEPVSYPVEPVICPIQPVICPIEPVICSIERVIEPVVCSIERVIEPVICPVESVIYPMDVELPVDLSVAVAIGLPIPAQPRHDQPINSSSSDSFIVFEGGDDDDDDDDVQDCSDSESESSDSSDSESSEESDDSEIDTDVEFKCAAAGRRNDTADCGKRRNDTADRGKSVPAKKVHFATGPAFCRTRILVTWQFAARATRKCYWEQFARDRARFARRIDSCAARLDDILKPAHRDRIYAERFQEQCDS